MEVFLIVIVGLIILFFVLVGKALSNNANKHNSTLEPSRFASVAEIENVNEPAIPYDARNNDSKETAHYEGAEIYDRYDPNLVQSSSQIILVSTYILATSRAIDTLTNRYIICPPIIKYLSNCHSSPRYLSDIQESIDKYKVDFYDRTINDYQIGMIVEPSIQTFNAFYLKALLDAAKRYEDEDLKKIDTLVTDKAKTKHYQALEEMKKRFANEITKASQL